MEVPRFRVELARRAYSDLAEIRAYISADSPPGADRVIESIFDRIDSLATFPRRFPRAPTPSPPPAKSATPPFSHTP